MHTALSARLAQLSTTPAVPASPKQLKADILDLAKECQVLPEQKFLLRITARSMAPLVRRVFGPLAMIFPLTETGRRHVYLAVLAKLDADNRLDAMEDTERFALLEKLLTRRNADLITFAYGSNPQGYLRLVTRLGDVARGKKFYLDLHSLLSEAPELAAPLLAEAGGEPLCDTMLEMMMVSLPREPAAVMLASQFPDRGRLETWLLAYQTLTGGEEIEGVHLTRIAAGESPDRIIEELYLSRAFPEARIPAHPQISHIKNGHELIATAKTFRNCLSSYVSEAVRGERQYYIWRKPGAAEVVFAIYNDTPYGWFLLEAKHEQNAELSSEMDEELRLMLSELGITRLHSMEQMMRPFLTDDDDIELLDWINA